MRRLLIGLAALLWAGLAPAHPLGNNTVNRQAAIEVSRQAISVRYLIDMAEIPALLAAQDADVDGDGAVSAAELDDYARRRGEEVRGGIEILADAAPLQIRLDAARWQRLPGAAGLDTLRLEMWLSAPLGGVSPGRVEYRDHRRQDEVGWKEVVARAGAGLRIARADVPQESPSRDLTSYPEPGGAIPGLLSAQIEVSVAPVDATEPERAMSPAARSSREALPAADVAAPARSRVADVEPATSARAQMPPAALPAAAAPSPPMDSRAGMFFRLGVHHIATGWDHLVFLIGLMVAHRSLRKLAWVITAFTAAHSLTLGLAASGLVAAPGSWVEPAIALTIAYVGLAGLVGRLRHGAALAFVFGLIHGLGFAGALAESLGGAQIGGAGWLIDLAAFNLGIEAFQLTLILALLPLFRMAARQSWSAMAQQTASAGILCAGLGWLFARI